MFKIFGSLKDHWVFTPSYSGMYVLLLFAGVSTLGNHLSIFFDALASIHVLSRHIESTNRDSYGLLKFPVRIRRESHFFEAYRGLIFRNHHGTHMNAHLPSGCKTRVPTKAVGLEGLWSCAKYTDPRVWWRKHVVKKYHAKNIQTCTYIHIIQTCSTSYVSLTILYHIYYRLCVSMYIVEYKIPTIAYNAKSTKMICRVYINRK